MDAEVLVMVLALAMLSCSGAQLAAHASECHGRMVTIADGPGTCEERRLKIQLLVGSDADCQEIYLGSQGPQLQCVLHDGGADDNR